MKTKIYLLLILSVVIYVKIYSQSALAENQTIEFCNLSLGSNYYSGDIYCFEDTKVTCQLRIASLSGKFQGTIIFTIGNESYAVTSENDEYFREVVQTLSKGKTTFSINLLPDIENNHRADASILIFATNKGQIGNKNILSTMER